MLREIEKREKEWLGAAVESQLPCSSVLPPFVSGERPKVSRDHLPTISSLSRINVRLMTDGNR